MTQEERDREMDLEMQREALDEISCRYKRAMRAQGYLVRMTEWHDGFQVCVFKKTDIRKCYVTGWLPYENQAWLEAFEWVVQNEATPPIR